MKVTEIKEGEVVLARHVPAEAAQQDGLNFFSKDEEFIQVGTWGYSAGKELKAHIHNEVPRTVLWTQEVIFVQKGKIKAFIFNTAGEKVTELEVSQGDVIILLRGGHGYEILEDGTKVLEIKNGPYVGAEMDRRRL
jgi:oxalate decarboxylase/phosphoglucose isomerase-like protein (cupin superfamily)